MDERDFSLITNVLDISHLTVLQDWIDFFDWPPQEIVVVIGRGKEIETTLRSFCEERKLKLSVVGVTDPNDLKDNEPQYLRNAFEAVENELAALVHLDTLPFRSGGKAWLKRALLLIEVKNALFVTGSTRLYKADTPTDDPDFFFTQRLSNNFLLISPANWIKIQDARANYAEEFGRFSSEAAIEGYCSDVGEFGIRVRNTLQLRVLHTQEWGSRMNDVRRKMHEGVQIKPFLDGWEEDFHDVPWKRFYGFPRPSRLQIVTRKIRNQFSIRTRLRRLVTKNLPKRDA